MKKHDNQFSNAVDEYLKSIKIRSEEDKLKFEIGGKEYRKTNRKLDEFLDRKLGDLSISKKPQNIIEDEFLVSLIFSSLYASAKIDVNSIWPEIETT